MGPIRCSAFALLACMLVVAVSSRSLNQNSNNQQIGSTALSTGSNWSISTAQRGGGGVASGVGSRLRRTEVKEEEEEPKPLTIRDRVVPFLEKYIDSTLYSKERSPKSTGDAEWNGFLLGWMLVVLPIPLPILILALSANTAILLASKWDDLIKNKYLIGFCHGVFSMAILLRELEVKQKSSSDQMFPSRIAMMGLNLASNLFLGQAGSFKITKTFMDCATFGTLIYILIRYFS